MASFAKGQRSRFFALALLSMIVALLIGCSSLQPARTFARAGSSDRLILRGATFRLERSSGDSVLIYSGYYRIEGEIWTFEITSWYALPGKTAVLDPPLLFVCKGRVFDNGVAFFEPTASHSAQIDEFLSLPSDFDLQK